MTQYEKNKNMTIEEMAKFIFGLGPYYSCALCPACKICDPNNQCVENIQKWLESEIKNDS